MLVHLVCRGSCCGWTALMYVMCGQRDGGLCVSLVVHVICVRMGGEFMVRFMCIV